MSCFANNQPRSGCTLQPSVAQRTLGKRGQLIPQTPESVSQICVANRAMCMLFLRDGDTPLGYSDGSSRGSQPRVAPTLVALALSYPGLECVTPSAYQFPSSAIGT